MVQLDEPNNISELIWEQKYRLKSFEGFVFENSIEETWERVARAISAPEMDRTQWTKTFRSAFEDFQLIPGGRITANAGSGRLDTLINTFMMGNLPNDLWEIYRSLGESAQTLRAGGGIGCNFSNIKPRFSEEKGFSIPASGPLSYMDLWDQMSRTTGDYGPRRGAMMAMLRCDHPDIFEFISAKRKSGTLTNFNISVLVTDSFIKAVLEDGPWTLRHNGTVYSTISASDLWRCIMENTYDYSEPGVLFIDKMNTLNNLRYCEEIIGTNSCGEIPLPSYGSCNLASINLAKLVVNPFQPSAKLNLTKFAELIATGVRMLDNVLEISNYPLEKQRLDGQAKRRIGLGITGLADALIMSGARYGTPQANTLITEWMNVFRTVAYLSSVDLAKERGCFPLYDRDKYIDVLKQREFPEHVVNTIRKYGIRNGVATAIAPTGTSSMYAGNVSSGIEPVFNFVTTRNIILGDGNKEQIQLHDYAYAKYKKLNGCSEILPEAFVNASQLTPYEHLTTQALVQKFIDSSIAKTINCPENLPFSDFNGIYLDAYNLGCKGCTTYRPTPVRGQVLS